jgi:hypothetical protein
MVFGTRIGERKEKEQYLATMKFLQSMGFCRVRFMILVPAHYRLFVEINSGA